MKLIRHTSIETVCISREWVKEQTKGTMWMHGKEQGKVSLLQWGSGPEG